MIRLIFILLAIFICSASCDKSYYQDGGVHNPKFNGTVIDFLKSRPELFDTLVKIIDLGGYTNLLNSPNADLTFFAPTNQSIAMSMKFLNLELLVRGQDTITDVSQVSQKVWRKYISKYIFNERNLLKDYPQLDTSNLVSFPGQNYISDGGDIMNIGAIYNDVKTKNSSGVDQSIKYAGYRQILIEYMNPVATSDIQPTNGVIHVLNFSRHSFGFKPFEFVIDAVNNGIN